MNTLYTLVADGACSGNPGPGGWAYMIFEGEDYVVGQVPSLEAAEGAYETTNNIMELTATAKALIALRDAKIRNATVKMRLDSEYVLNGIFSYLDGWKAKGWRKSNGKPVLNVSLWSEIDLLLTDLRGQGISFVKDWVKGHAGDPANERIDSEAARMRDHYKDHGILSDAAQFLKAVTPHVLNGILGDAAQVEAVDPQPEPGSVLDAALEGDVDTELKAILDDYAEGNITVKGARKRLALLRL